MFPFHLHLVQWQRLKGFHERQASKTVLMRHCFTKKHSFTSEKKNLDIKIKTSCITIKPSSRVWCNNFLLFFVEYLNRPNEEFISCIYPRIYKFYLETQWTIDIVIKNLAWNMFGFGRGWEMIILFHNHIIILVSPKLTLKVVADDTGWHIDDTSLNRNQPIA